MGGIRKKSRGALPRLGTGKENKKTDRNENGEWGTVRRGGLQQNLGGREMGIFEFHRNRMTARGGGKTKLRSYQKGA